MIIDNICIAEYNTLVDARESSMKIDLLSALLLLPMFIFRFVYFQSNFQKKAKIDLVHKNGKLIVQISQLQALWQKYFA